MSVASDSPSAYAAADDLSRSHRWAITLCPLQLHCAFTVADSVSRSPLICRPRTVSLLPPQQQLQHCCCHQSSGSRPSYPCPAAAAAAGTSTPTPHPTPTSAASDPAALLQQPPAPPLPPGPPTPLAITYLGLASDESDPPSLGCRVTPSGATPLPPQAVGLVVLPRLLQSSPAFCRRGARRHHRRHNASQSPELTPLHPPLLRHFRHLLLGSPAPADETAVSTSAAHWPPYAAVETV